MDKEFWRERWANNQIAFHEGKPNALLIRNFSALQLRPGQRIFVPLCGKATDIPWLMSQQCRVAGVELSETAVKQLFDEIGVQPAISESESMKCYSARNIDVFVGDLFELTSDVLGPVDAIYDRAALVALPAAMRQRYAQQLVEITNAAPQLLISFDYDQEMMEGPPFSVDEAEITSHYQNVYEIQLVEAYQYPTLLKGVSVATENAWLLSTR
ncbi:MAG: thiopurine S-methyltransferase [Wenzhouxiangellaceae bacterium]